MKYSVIIPTAFDHLETELKPCIESIIQYTTLEKIELIVVANGCTPNVIIYLKELNKIFPHYKLLEYPEALGYSKAVNKGIDAATGEYTIFLNNDTTLMEQRKDHWLEMLEDPFNVLGVDKVGVTGPLKIFHAESNYHFIVFFCAMCRTSLAKEQKLNEEYGLGYGEDIEFCIEAELKGLQNISVPSAHGELEKRKDRGVVFTGGFPIFHDGGVTVNSLDTFQNTVKNNLYILSKKYNRSYYRKMMAEKNDYPVKYSIIIPTAFDYLDAYLKPCLESLKNTVNLEDVEIIVVSNGATDGTDDYVRSLGEPFKLLTYPEPLGYAAACNKGIDVARGKYTVLLNNDAVLLDQPKNEWLDNMTAPFINNPDVGIVGPYARFNDETHRTFIVFFCVMIRTEILKELHLNEEYGLGTCEDIEFCIEAEKLGYTQYATPKIAVYHKGGATMSAKGSSSLFKKNSKTIAEKYSPSLYKKELTNNGERVVIDNKEDLSAYTKEVGRYKFAAANIKGKKILEIGCSSGYGLRFLPEDIDYTGIDYDAKVLSYARGMFPRGKFIHCDAHDFKFTEHYDTIIAYEFIEHITDGKEFAQKLKQHCDKLIISTPFKEPPGVWGPHHRIHNITQADFPEFDYKFIHESGALSDRPDPTCICLMLMTWEKGKEYNVVEPTVLAFIPTKNRYDCLSIALQSIAFQTRPPNKVLIYDDGEHKDLRNESLYKHIFNLLNTKGIDWEVIFGNGKGQHYGHQIANSRNYTYVWRVDDDEAPEPDVLERLIKLMKPDVGAAAGAVFSPGEAAGSVGTNSLIDILHTANIQWKPDIGVYDVEHLYSSFIYRPNIARYDLRLSPAAHREETMFSHEIKRKGYKLLVDTSIKTYHYRHPSGGIRETNEAFYFENDERIFKEKLEEWGIKVITLNTGLGDHLVFLNILPDLQKKYKHIVLGMCYPEVFEGIENITLAPVAHTEKFTDDHVYKWCIDNNFQGSILEAYKLMFGV